jgi:hypothetical protein
MWLAYSYVDVALGLFSTKEIAEQAMLDYHGNEHDARVFGIIEEYQVDITREGKCYAPAVEPVAPLVSALPPTVSRLPLSGSYTPTQALQLALQEAPRLANLLVVGEYVSDGVDNGELYVLPSRMSMLEVSWLERRLCAHIDRHA